MKAIKNYPEILLIGLNLFYWHSTSVVLNPVAIAIMVLLALQLKFKWKTFGIVLPALLLFICFYMSLALMSEFREFPSINYDALVLLGVGSMFLVTIAASSILMMVKYAK